MTRLTNLDATFVGQQSGENFTEQEGIIGAQGVLFDCPLCGKHSILVWFRNPINAPKVPDDLEPGPGRWTASGSSLGDLTLDPSINLDVIPTATGIVIKTCKWHGWVKSGNAT